jgi:hypothetical protein
MSNNRSQLDLNTPTITDLDRTDDTSRDVDASERAGQRGEDLPVSPRGDSPEIRTVERAHGPDRPDTDHSTGGDHRPVSHTPDRADPPAISVRETSAIEVRHADSRDGGDMPTGSGRIVERADGAADAEPGWASRPTLHDDAEHLRPEVSPRPTGSDNPRSNVITGNDGDNLLDGRGGSDVLIGGAGNDRFVFTAPSDSGPTREGVDQIRDFGRGDIIDRCGTDANSGARGDQPLKFIDAQEFTRDAGELHVVRDGGHTSVQRDANGDGVADFHVALMGQPNVTESSFVF